MGDRRPYPTGNPGAPVNPAGTAPEATVELREIRKRYGSVVALDGADLLARPGEVHAVLGENGAGKTTLLRVLAGSVVPDTGAVLVDGAPARFSTPRDANARGIGMVHQHFTLVPALTIAENVALGVPSRSSPWVPASASRS